MSAFSTVILFLICSLCIYSVFSTKHNTIRGQKLLCGTYAPDLVNLTCKFKRVNRTTEFWSFEGSFSPGFNIADNLFINFSVYARQQNLEWRPFMVINVIIDVCKYMDGSLSNKVLDIVVKDLKKYSNIIHPCPYFGSFYVRNMTFNDEDFPPIVPNADIYANFQYFTYIIGIPQNLHYVRPYLELKTKGIFYFKK